jgi:hypothetical protein
LGKIGDRNISVASDYGKQTLSWSEVCELYQRFKDDDELLEMMCVAGAGGCAL